MFDFNGKVAIVTGGTRSIGAAVSKMLASNGASVVAAYSGNKERAKKLEKEILTSGGKCVTFGGNLCDTANSEGLVKRAMDEFGSIDILVNNHGIWNDGPIDKMSLATWDELMDVNLHAVFYLTQLVSLHMIKKGSGKIINVSSTAAQRGRLTTAIMLPVKVQLIPLPRAFPVNWHLMVSMSILLLQAGSIQT